MFEIFAESHFSSIEQEWDRLRLLHQLRRSRLLERQVLIQHRRREQGQEDLWTFFEIIRSLYI